MTEKLGSAMSYSAVDHGRNANEPTTNIKEGIFKQKHSYNKVMY